MREAPLHSCRLNPLLLLLLLLLLLAALLRLPPLLLAAHLVLALLLLLLPVPAPALVLVLRDCAFYRQEHSSAGRLHCLLTWHTPPIPPQH